MRQISEALKKDWISEMAEIQKKVPCKMKACFLTCITVGVLAYFFMFSNAFFFNDDAWIYHEPSTVKSMIYGAAASRWLSPVVTGMTSTNIKMPWLMGILSLSVYGIGAYYVTEIMEMGDTVSAVLISAVIVTCPTVVDSMVCEGGAVAHSIAFLASVLALHAFLGKDRSWMWLYFGLVITEGLYAAYIDVTLSLFFIWSLMNLVLRRHGSSKALLKKHMSVFLACVASVATTYGIMLVCRSIGNVAFQERVTDVESRGLANWIVKAAETYARAVFCFLPGGLSFFWGNKILFVLFWAVIVWCVLLMIKTARENGVFADRLYLLLFMADLCVLPFAMNAIGMLYTTHDLMRMAFIAPWLLIVAFSSRIRDTVQECVEGRKKAFSNAVLVLCIVTAVNGVYLANAAFTKLYNIYESGMQLTARLADRIESAEGYIPGETPVYLVGDFFEHYAPEREEYGFLDSLTYFLPPVYDTAFTYGDVEAVYLQQQSGLDIKFAATPYFWDQNGEKSAAVLTEAGYDIDEEEYYRLFDETEAFPSRECTFLLDGILVVKQSEYHEPWRPDRNDFAHRIRNMLDPYED